MAESRLYDDLVMDHIKNARNFRVIESADRQASGLNPLCGDEVVVYATIISDAIAEVAYQCTCCGISMASASIMTDLVKGRPVEEAKSLLREFVELLNELDPCFSLEFTPEQLAIVEAVRKFPARVRCAALPWSTLEAALNRQEITFVP